MDPERRRLRSAPARDVDLRWQGIGEGEHYARSRWRTARARERDPGMVRRLLRGLGRDLTGASALDVPCGAGRLRPALVGLGLGWTGVDISPSMLEVAAEGRRVLRASADRLPFADRSFDVVVCCRLLHHYQDGASRRAVLTELARVTRGEVLVSYWDAASLAAWRRRTRGPLRRRKGRGVRHAVPWKVLRAELQRAGLEPTRRVFSMRYLSAQTFVLARRAEGGPAVT